MTKEIQMTKAPRFAIARCYPSGFDTRVSSFENFGVAVHKFSTIAVTLPFSDKFSINVVFATSNE